MKLVQTIVPTMRYVLTPQVVLNVVAKKVLKVMDNFASILTSAIIKKIMNVIRTLHASINQDHMTAVVILVSKVMVSSAKMSTNVILGSAIAMNLPSALILLVRSSVRLDLCNSITQINYSYSTIYKL